MRTAIICTRSAHEQDVEVWHPLGGVGQAQLVHARRKVDFDANGNGHVPRRLDVDFRPVLAVDLDEEGAVVRTGAEELQCAPAATDDADILPDQVVRCTFPQITDSHAARSPSDLSGESRTRLDCILQLLIVRQESRLRLIDRAFLAPFGVKAEEPRTVRRNLHEDMALELADVRPIHQVECRDASTEIKRGGFDAELVFRIARIVQGDIAGFPETLLSVIGLEIAMIALNE